MPLDNPALIEHLKRDVLKSKGLEKALRGTPRELFVPEECLGEAYEDYPLPLGHGQTISQPWTVVFMTEMLDVKKGMKVLEIGAGSGWQAALLGYMVGPRGKVLTVEINEWLADFARKNVAKTRLNNVFVARGDGTLGLKEEAPFNRIIITAATPKIPKPLEEQLREGGKLVAPVGRFNQVMVLYQKTKKGLEEKQSRGYFRFVPLVGKYGFRKRLW
jgi:protein-L-isoaspartate(D-aspartate) O-methyltransferase